MDRSPPRTLLEKIVRQSTHTIEETCAQFEQTSRDMGERAALSPRQLSRWMAGHVDTARPVMQRVAQQLWGHTFRQLLAPPGRRDTTLSSDDVRRVEIAAQPTSNSLEAAAIMAAHESSRHAASAGGSIDPASIEQIQSEVARLAGCYHETSPIVLLGRARLTRNMAYTLLERTRRPTQTAELYLVAAQACALMALASFDLAVWEAAEDQARSAFAYADLAGHPEMRAWSRGTQALISYWSSQPRRATNLVQSVIDEAPRGAVKARLHGIHARAWARLGDSERVVNALREADRAMDELTGDDDLHDHIGGEFGWSPSLHSACAGTALLDVGDAVQAARRIRTAIDTVSTAQTDGLVNERIYVDLATAELAAGRLDVAIGALERVWPLPAAHRRHGITSRLDGIARSLTHPVWRGIGEAGVLRDRIEVYNTEATDQRALTA